MKKVILTAIALFTLALAPSLADARCFRPLRGLVRGTARVTTMPVRFVRNGGIFRR